ncbi:hypothetical protein M405DRAFT_819654 [Rhizopogon salebrosus TDB-379]|nr:hypothetical protein M405DRAFT_819654 [Rhizopogon salebrosus TDB-379]
MSMNLMGISMILSSPRVGVEGEPFGCVTAVFIRKGRGCAYYTFLTQTPNYFSLWKAQPFGRLSVDRLMTGSTDKYQGYSEKFHVELHGFLCLSCLTLEQS